MDNLKRFAHTTVKLFYYEPRNIKVAFDIRVSECTGYSKLHRADDKNKHLLCASTKTFSQFNFGVKRKNLGLSQFSERAKFDWCIFKVNILAEISAQNVSLAYCGNSS